MALQNINVGNLANDGTGDDLRDAFVKVNQNFQELENLENLRGSNLGTAGSEVFASFVNGQFNFRKIISGENITVTQLENTIKIDAAATNLNLAFTTEQGSILVPNGTNVTFQGDDNVLIQGSNNTKTVNVSLRGDLTKYLSFDFGESFTPSKTSILDFVISTVGVDLGTFFNPSPYNIDLGAI